MEKTVYTDIIQSKDGLELPLKDKTSFHSKYAPEKEAVTFANQIEVNGEHCFFIIIGLCGGYHIEKLKEKYPFSKIIAVEKSKEDIDFLSSIECVKKLKKEKNIFIADLNTLENTVIENYIPALDGSLIIKPLRAYETAFRDTVEKAQDIIKGALKAVSADYSVQKHFGKIWQHNILENLSLAGQCASFSDFTADFDLSKTAAIIAAGPSLNETIQKLKDKRNRYFIISTDTAYSALQKQKIESDAVVSVDGQMVSHSHFMKQSSPETRFVFDLCSSPGAVKRTLKNGSKVLLSESNHPLAVFAGNYSGKKHFIHLETGSGTVTIAAASFAVACGFKKIELFGADFSYINGLPYVRGTYLDSNFRQNETRLSNAETKFVNLLYRTQIQPLSQNAFTTEVLTSYKKTLEAFFQNNKIQKLKENEYLVQSAKEKESYERFDFADFKEKYLPELKKLRLSGNDIDTTRPVFLTLLPLCAALGENSAFIAYSKTLSYTENL